MFLQTLLARVHLGDRRDALLEAKAAMRTQISRLVPKAALAAIEARRLSTRGKVSLHVEAVKRSEGRGWTERMSLRVLAVAVSVAGRLQLLVMSNLTHYCVLTSSAPPPVTIIAHHQPLAPAPVPRTSPWRAYQRARGASRSRAPALSG